MNTKERLLELYRVYNTNATSVAAMINENFPHLNFSRQTLYNVDQGLSQNISVKTAKSILKIFPKINPQWLMFGTGSMFNEASTPKCQPHKIRVILSDSASITVSKNKAIDIIEQITRQLKD